MNLAARPPPISSNSPIAAEGDDLASNSDGHQADTQSLSASITDYPIHWGRRYHRYREGAYPFPNDEPESDRLNDQHDIFTDYFNGQLYLAPLDPETCFKVLDIGTGTGIWPIELAESNALPNASITGIDLSAIQPEMVPENVTFEVQDCCDPDWLRSPGEIDFIHSRFMAGSIQSWKQLLKTSRSHLRPGEGWLELHELHPTPQCDDGTMPKDWGFKEWEEKLDVASRKKDPFPRNIRVAHLLEQWMRECDFVDIAHKDFKIPLGPWPKDARLKRIGAEMCSNWASGLQGFTYKLFGEEGLGMSQNEIELELVHVRNSLAMKEVHAYVRYYVVFGRRPNEAEEKLIEDRRSRGEID